MLVRDVLLNWGGWGVFDHQVTLVLTYFFLFDNKLSFDHAIIDITECIYYTKTAKCRAFQRTKQMGMEQRWLKGVPARHYLSGFKWLE